MIEDFVRDQFELQAKLVKEFGEICLILIKENVDGEISLPESLSILQKRYKKRIALLFANAFLEWNQRLYKIDKKAVMEVNLEDITPKLRNFTSKQKKLILSILHKSQYFDAPYFIDLCLLVKNSNSSIILTKRLNDLNRKIKSDLSL